MHTLPITLPLEILKLIRSVNPLPRGRGLEDFKFGFIEWGISKITGRNPSLEGMKNNWRGDACNSINRLSGCPIVLEFFEFLELFWIFFGTGNVLEKTPFGIALQDKIFTINFLHYFQLPPVWIFYL